jgi:hypothetical protein
MAEAASRLLRAARKVMMRSCPTCALAEWNWTAIPLASLNGGWQSHHQEESSFQEIHCANLDWSYRQEAE